MRPIPKLLAVELQQLVSWEQFALQLPGIDDSDICLIKKNHPNDTNLQKLELYSTWKTKCPVELLTWETVIEALEKTENNSLACEIKRKYLRKRPISLTKDAFDTLEDLHSEFVDLKGDVKKALETKRLSDVIRATKNYGIQIQSLTLKDFENSIQCYYNFLDCDLLLHLAINLKFKRSHSSVYKQVEAYHEKIENFLKQTKISEISDMLEAFFKPDDDFKKMEITLHKAWGDKSMYMVKDLVETWLSLKQTQKCHYWSVCPLSDETDRRKRTREEQSSSQNITVTFRILKTIMPKVIETSKLQTKVEFMKLTGIVAIQIDDLSRFLRDTNFSSFPNQFKKAKSDKNREVCKFFSRHRKDLVAPKLTSYDVENSFSKFATQTHLLSMQVERFFDDTRQSVGYIETLNLKAMPCIRDAVSQVKSYVGQASKCITEMTDAFTFECTCENQLNADDQACERCFAKISKDLEEHSQILKEICLDAQKSCDLAAEKLKSEACRSRWPKYLSQIGGATSILVGGGMIITDHLTSILTQTLGLTTSYVPFIGTITGIMFIGGGVFCVWKLADTYRKSANSFETLSKSFFQLSNHVISFSEISQDMQLALLHNANTLLELQARTQELAEEISTINTNLNDKLTTELNTVRY